MLVGEHHGSVRIARQFVDVNGRAVHYRRGGRGPVLVAVHESPRSSRTVKPLIAALAGRFHVIAPDTPGFGLSDPIRDEPLRLDDLAHALAETLDALGVERHVLYGTHTGAAIAIRYARMHPHRVAALVLDGVAAFSGEERQEFLTRYLEPWQPAWDGSHVAHLWSRSRDMRFWFPWQRREPGTRLAADPDGPAIVHETVLGYLMAGPGYKRGYACATELDADPELRSLTVPTTIFARPEDVLRKHGARLPETPYVQNVVLADGDDAWREAVSAAAARGVADPVDARAPCGASRMIELGDGALLGHVRGEGPTGVVLVDDVPSCGADWSTVAARLPGRVAVLNLPGCAGSDALADETTPATLADAVDRAARALGFRSYDAVGVGAASAILGALERSPSCTRTFAVRPPGWLRDRRPYVHVKLPREWRPDFSGQAFLGSWYTLRDLWFYEDVHADRLAVRTGVDAPDVDTLERRFVRYWLSPRAVYVYDALRRAAEAGRAAIGRARVVGGLEQVAGALATES